MKNNQLYPLKFDPIFKEKVWGGNKLRTVLDKNAAARTGESWELSAVSSDVSIVSNGPLKGRSLNVLIEQFGESLLGKHVQLKYGNEFPLLFKFIDACEDLSVQLHPDDILAKSRHDSFGKTEMWYIIECDKDARLVLGFNRKMDLGLYKKLLAENNITSVLHSETIKAGEAFFIASGTVHAIGAGTLLAEIQQTSDITYRIYDWDRPDSDGNLRELHTELAQEAIDFSAPNPKLVYKDQIDRVVNICSAKYFETNKIRLNNPMERRIDQPDSFRVYMCIEGDGIIGVDTLETHVRKGDTILVPACFDKVLLKTKSATFLEVYIP